MLKPSGNFSLAVGSLSTAVAIGSAGTGANFASAAVLGAPCIHPGPALGWAEGGTGGWVGDDGLTAGCCGQAGAAAATIPAATAPNNRLRERNRKEFMAIPPGSLSQNPGARASGRTLQ